MTVFLGPPTTQYYAVLTLKQLFHTNWLQQLSLNFSITSVSSPGKWLSY